jgi:carboxyl-terminal processing protease
VDRVLRSVLVLICLVFPAMGDASNIVEEIAEAIHHHHISRPPMEAALSVPLERMNAYLRSLDPYSLYIPADEYQRRKQIEKEGYQGIGAELTRNDCGIVIIPYQGGPAYRAGIRERHYLSAVNGYTIDSMDLKEAAWLLTGAPGSRVNVRVSPFLGGRNREVIVVREKFITPSVESITESFGTYLRIRSFRERSTVSSLKSVIRQRQAQGFPVILDLRDAQGRDFHEALDAISLFIPEGQCIAKVVGGSGVERLFYSLPYQQLVFRKIIILVGPSTASAAEVFASALRHYSRATLVGQKTYGKCTSQMIIELSDGSALKLTNLKIIYPSGEFCNGIGLTPDIEVSDEELYQTKKLIDRGDKQALPSVSP